MESDRDDEPVSDAERARVERRERKRRPRMVVDNAGVRRLRQALAQRRDTGSSEEDGGSR